MKLLLSKNNERMIKKKKEKKEKKGTGFGFFTQPSKFFHTLYFQSKNLFLIYLHQPGPDGLIRA